MTMSGEQFSTATASDTRINGMVEAVPTQAANPEPPAEPAAEPAKLVEMRQVAGLTAGSVAKLGAGTFQFRESDQEVGFSLHVDENGLVTVYPGSAPAMVEEILITEPTPLGDAVLNVGSACFIVSPPRPASTPEYRLQVLEAAREPTPAIAVPTDLAAHDDEIASQTSSNRFGALFSRSEGEQQMPFGSSAWEFLETIRDIRSQVAQRHRYLHPDPEELRSRMTRLDPGLWDRTPDHPLFARFAVAYATIPWEPRFDEPNNIPVELHQPIRQMSCLAWVPITANLLSGPLGIVGHRPAVLAAARSAVISLACLSGPHAIEFSIVTAEDMVDSWNWTSALPSALFPTGDSNYRIAVADGMSHFEGAGLDHAAVRRGDMGLIALGETLDDLPDYCATVLQLDAGGRCLATNHLGERVQGTPIGMTSGFAGAMANAITETVGDNAEIPPKPAAESGPAPAPMHRTN